MQSTVRPRNAIVKQNQTFNWLMWPSGMEIVFYLLMWLLLHIIHFEVNIFYINTQNI